ncbi:hypothetical protein [Leisingera aquaemixtae]|uniref:Uncharacterized protein n=1 Tax=Leisingera aquaemixtae TaxID=1396826 RepID=A0A0P1H827_9RHOB|nr:hypothetical protein [Leisingera aquaemixtae]CUH99171.1 hypothetical protein PHA8399_01287 [Leisingera aquaemixtae]
MAEQENSAGAELLPPNKLVVLRNLSWLSLIALAVPFVAILMPGIATLLNKDPSVLTALINLSWVLVVFGGFAFLVVSLFSAAVLFRVFNMHDKAHSLGLPRNSIRSLLTFLVFLILMAFIFYSTQVASTQSSTGNATVPIEELKETIALLELSGAVTGYEIEVKEDGTRHAKVTFLVQEESAAMEYFDRILVALLGISSTIIGFYFGSRSNEGPLGSEERDQNDKDATTTETSAEEPETADEADSLDWSITSQMLTLKPAQDGTLAGVVMINPSDPEGDREFGAQLVPTKDHDPDVDAASVEVTRVANRLELRVSGIEAARLTDLEMSIFYRDEEEQANSLPIELEVDTQ